MLKFHPDKLVDIFIKHYMYDYGEKKIKEIILTVQQSDKVQDHIRYLLINDHAPTDISIAAVLNSITYFLISRPETLCLGGLIFIVMWKDILIDTYDGPFEEAFEDQSNRITTKICSDYLIRCSKMKLKKVDTCFTKLFDEIDFIRSKK